MNTTDIIIEIDAQISRLQQVRALLADTSTTAQRKPGRPAGASLPSNTKAVHIMSTEARAKIGAAQKARWTKSRKAEKKEVRNVATAPAAKKTIPNGVAPKVALAKKVVSVKKSGQAKSKTPATPAS